jgi:hypothetical protein
MTSGALVEVALAGLPESVWAVPRLVVLLEKVTGPSAEVGVWSPLGVATVALNISLGP